MMPRGFLLLLVVTVACGRDAGRDSAADSAFAGVQARGHDAMGVDHYTSTHRFEPLSDG